MSRLLLGASQVVTCRGPARARRGSEMAALDVVERGAVLIGDDGLVQAVGDGADLRRDYPDADIDEIEGVLFPGFVDSHTHAVFGAARLADHERRARGTSYKEIAACISIPIGTVMSRLWAARRALRKALGPTVAEHE